MARDKSGKTEVAVPRGRLARLSHMSSLGTGIAGNMLVDGVKRLSKGERPSMQDLLLTPKNASKAADELSRLRGAAMKVGQLISLDSGDFLPPELADILARLRSSAHSMPPHQLKRVLIDNWGKDWRSKTVTFNVRPIAAASIGQVHYAKAKDGQELAIKIQYPGVRESIDSDVDNVTTLIRMSGLVPKNVDIGPILKEAKAQLKEEADYKREAEHMRRYAEQLSGSDDFEVPEPHDELTTTDILAMTYLRGAPIEDQVHQPQALRNEIVTRLMKLLLDELFTFRLIQTDPNFANYFYNDESGKLVLLDFGATRDIPQDLSDGYRALFKAAVADDWETCRREAIRMGLLGDETDSETEKLIEDIFALVIEPLKSDAPFDFGKSEIAMKMRDKGMTLRQNGYHHVPPPETLFIHRKIGGIYLLATRLKAQVNVHALAADYL